MLVVAAFVAALVTVPLAGGRLGALADVRVRSAWALWSALALQVLVIFVAPDAPHTSLAAGHLVSYCAAAYFMVRNRHIPGWWLVGLGGLLNFAAIAFNAGVMPASASAVAAAGLAEVPGRFSNSAVAAAPSLAWFGDVFAIPAGWPLANVFSAGDVCLVVGGAVALHRICGSRLAPSGEGEFTALFEHRGFVRVWSAQAVSNVGDWIYALAVAATLVRRSEGVGALAGLLVAQVGPGALAGLLGGALLDRVSRRPLMIALDAMRAAAVVTLLLDPEPGLAHLYAVAACLGVGEALFQPCVHASIPNLVPRARIVAANSLVAATFNAAVMAGPVLGGVLVARLGLAPLLACNACSFVVSALLLWRVALPRPVPSDASPVADLRAGLRYAAGSPLVRGVLAVTCLVMLAAALRSPLEPVFVLGTLGLRPEALGLLGGCWGLGMVLGVAAAPAAARRWRREHLLPAGILLVGGAVFGASQASALGSVAGLWLLSGVGNALGTVSYESLLQERTPDAVRGRVMAASEATLNLSYLVGVGLAGRIGAALGVRAGFALSGAIFLLGAAASLALVATRRPRHAAPRRAPRMA